MNKGQNEESVDSLFEQAEGHMSNVARAIGSYYRDLKAQKLPTLLIWQLIVEYQKLLTGQSSQKKD